MTEFMNGFQKLIDIISNAFSILDFSYIVSGGLAFLLILFGLYMHDISFMMENITITIVCGIFLSYVCGLFAWLIGRYLRRKTYRRFYGETIEESFQKVYNETIYSLTSFPSGLGLAKAKDASLSYEYMWICLDKNKDAVSRVNYIHRFWVMQAVFEGLITVLLMAVVVLWLVIPADPSCMLIIGMVVLTLVFIFLAGFCCNEAKRCAETQIREVILSYYKYVIIK